ncbi:hypothetical protein GCM10020367_69190 [Streptomyces sannanensis]|uniref:IstB-like ATP-binding domain-containing protein n=1 Tax=Streptomyces sannanensis TaxID=285536 RepID=A0ABP6SNU4_9ACTN
MVQADAVPGLNLLDEAFPDRLDDGRSRSKSWLPPARAGRRSQIRTSERVASPAPPQTGLDRLLHHCDVISINGPSYRLKNRLKAIERDTDVA